MTGSFWMWVAVVVLNLVAVVINIPFLDDPGRIILWFVNLGFVFYGTYIALGELDG